MFTTATPTTASRNADRIARVAAAGRIAAERVAAERARAARAVRAEGSAARIVASIRAEGATRAGFKIDNDMGRYRVVLDLDDAAWQIASCITNQDCFEVWGLDADGEHTGLGSY